MPLVGGAGAFHLCYHFALCKRLEKTVMAPQNFVGAPESLAVSAAQGGLGRQALDHLFSITYEELRRLAYSVTRA